MANDASAYGIQNEEVWEAILYGYVIDPDAPAFLGRGDRIFDISTDEQVDELIAISSNSQMHMQFEYSDSEHTAAKNFAASVSIEGSYGAFSAAASMEVSKSSSSSIKTVRMDALTKAIVYEVSSIGGFRTFPERYVTNNFKEAVKALSVEQIEKRIGVFYATKMNLGGELRKSYIMQATEEDSEQSITTELQASYGNSMMGISATASLGVSSRDSTSSAQMNVEWSAKGGDTTVWLGRTFDPEDDSGVREAQLEIGLIP